MTDRDDAPTEEELTRWFQRRRAEAIAYLARHDVRHGRLQEVPAWHLYPKLSVWAIESGKAPGWVGWWVICGDCPTDYVTCSGDRTPRAAIEEIAARWRQAAPFLARGEQHPDFVIGEPGNARDLAPALAARAEALNCLLQDDAIWD
jgi:Domain of unknown function (DUF4826)